MALTSCSNEHQPELKDGPWCAVLMTPGGELPFGLEISRFTRNDGDSDSALALILNGEERIAITDITQEGDSIFLRLPVFDSEIRARLSLSEPRDLSGEEVAHLEGRWIDHNRINYSIPFRAEHGVAHRFGPTTEGALRHEEWGVTFSPGTDSSYKAKGVFRLNGTHAEGTFLTETGDYRYLEGMIRHDSLLLSCFDGSHAFLFKSRRVGDSMTGMFWSGRHFSEAWEAVLNPGFELRDADSLTFLKPGYDRFEFSFPDIDGKHKSLNDFRGKVVIVQIMGSWCPNCMDESRFFADAWNQYHHDGLEIVGLSFEKTRDFNTARDRVIRMKANLGIPYPVLIAGYRDPKEVAEKLPALNRLMSYPTSIFIDRQGEVRRIHTGFNGPATGEAHDAYRIEFRNLVESLLLAE
jgi:peroxiredoxin